MKTELLMNTMVTDSLNSDVVVQIEKKKRILHSI